MADTIIGLTTSIEGLEQDINTTIRELDSSGSYDIFAQKELDYLRGKLIDQKKRLVALRAQTNE